MNISILSTSSFLTTTLHLCTVISLPIHCLGTYCILFQSPNFMNSVRWTMFNLQLWGALMDFSLSILTCPFLFAPALAWSPMGVLSMIGVPGDVQAYLQITVFAIVGSSILSIFENRFYVMFATGTWWSKARYFFIIFDYSMALIFFAPLLFEDLDQKQAIKIVQQNFPDIPLSTHPDPVFIASLDYRLILYPMVLIDFWNLTQTVILWALLHVNMVKLGKRIAISNQTYLLQKKFLQALTIQITVPFCILSFPIFYLTYSITNSFYSQAMNNLCVILVSLHGWITGIIMLFIHESFRRFCLGLVFQPKIEVQRNVSESIKSTVQ